EDMNFDLLWYSAGALSDSGYTAIMKIPFKSLSFPDEDEQDWSIQFIRNYPRSSRYLFSWTKINRGNSCVMCQSGEMTNLHGIKSTNVIEFLPYAMSYQSSAMNNTEDPFSGLDHG